MLSQNLKSFSTPQALDVATQSLKEELFRLSKIWDIVETFVLEYKLFKNIAFGDDKEGDTAPKVLKIKY